RNVTGVQTCALPISFSACSVVALFGGDPSLIDVSIVIVSFNARDDLERCLGSLHASPPAVPHEIVVVDNASTDGSAGAARRYKRSEERRVGNGGRAE